MGRLRFSVAGLMKFIVVVAVGAAAFRDPTENWTFVVFVLALAVLVDATLRARFGPREDQAWWFGFSLFGWLHLVLGSTKFSGYLPTLFLTPQRVWDSLPTAKVTEWNNRHLIINVVMSLTVALLGGTLTG